MTTYAEYEKFVAHDTGHLSREDALCLGGMGCGGEGGEVCDEMKKVTFHGKELNPTKLAIELGDMFWYMTLLMRRTGISFEEIMQRNITKLCERYPDRYGPYEDWL